MQLNDVVKRRYSTKAFDPQRKLPQEAVEQIINVLRWCPSSTNLQPWHFIVASTAEGKQRIASGATENFKYNRDKILDASHVVLMCAHTEVSQEHLQQVLAAEDAAGRFPSPQAKETVHNTRTSYANLHRFVQKDVPHWLEKQVYLNLGSLLLAAGVLEIDAVALEGLDFKVLNQEFELNQQGMNAVVAVALGYRAENDFNASLPKARLAQEQVFTLI